MKRVAKMRIKELTIKFFVISTILLVPVIVYQVTFAQVAPGVHQNMDYIGGDLPGGDYKKINFDKYEPKLCRDACYKDKRCKAYTMFKSGHVQGKFSCSLKDKVSELKPDLNCMSGIKKPLDVDKREGLP